MAKRRRNVKKHIRTLKEAITLYVTGLIICLYIGYLCGGVYIEGNTLPEFLDHFREFIIEGHHYIVGITEGTPLFLISLSCIWTLAYAFHVTERQHPYAGEEYGNARWGNARSFTREYACRNPKYIVEAMTGDVDLGHTLKVNTGNYWIADGVYISIFNKKTSNLNILVVGPPGSGKSFRLVRPILSQLCGNFVCTDPKGELYKQCGQYFEENGYEVIVINVESEEAMPMSSRFNPFEYIRNESDIMSIAGILMKATTPPEENSGNDQFFEQSAEVLLTSIIYLIHYYYPKEEQNWKTFVKLLDATCVYTTKEGAIDNRPGGILDIAGRAQKAWKEDRHMENDFPGYVSIEKYYNGAAETTSSIVASLDAHCRYMKLECVADLLSEDEIRIADSFGYSRPDRHSKTGKRILFIVTSEDKRYYDWIPSMIYSLFFDELYHLTTIDPKLKETLPQHLTFLMDEFSNVTLPDSFVKKLSTMRSRNISSVIIVQNLIQLKGKFPKFDMDKDLIANCNVIDILGAPDMDSCEYLSKHFGTQTIYKASDSITKGQNGQSSRTEDVIQKPLFSPEDIFAMKKDGECAIVVKGADPLYQPKCQMEKTDFIKLLCRKDNPYNPRKNRRIRMIEGEKTFFIGQEAIDEANRLREQGLKIAHMTMEEMGAYFEGILLSEPEKPLISLDTRKKLKENAKQHEKKKELQKPIALEEFRSGPDGKVCDSTTYLRRCMIIRELINEGFSNMQIRYLKPLIMEGSDHDMIRRLFSPDSGISEIEEYIRQACVNNTDS
ncbi:MAG: type IV secretory system conjugative DNA transfer family protein [Lachnospiraceae bacterium]|nr:type IV secretory system conjugative DNA transfer family protein [Lachnospiraceae bacterium]